MVRRTHIALLAALAATLVATGPADAQRGGNRNPFGQNWDNGQENQREASLDSILRDLRRQYGGRHLGATRSGNRWIIPWITGDGKRLTIEVDAETGRIMSTR